MYYAKVESAYYTTVLHSIYGPSRSSATSDSTRSVLDKQNQVCR